MTERLIGETGSRKRRRFLLLPVVLIAFVSLFVITAAQAVHGEEFQLDGNTLASLGTNVGGSAQDFDWDSLFDSAGAEKALPSADFTASGFKRDFVTGANNAFLTSDTTTFATGSKDSLPISGWQCNFDNNVNSKIDVMNAYAATFVDRNGAGVADDEEIIYFALERNANTGSANVAFWFLQEDVGCSTTGAAATFTGAHRAGDLLIVSEFSGGGTVSTIVVYEWVGGANGFLNQTPVASGVDCRSGTTPADDTVCATANTAAISTPWLTAAKTLNPNVGHSLPTAQFFEGGLNLTQADLGGTCFTTFLGDTRSSTSLTATLFDYAGGRLGDCGSGVVTTPSAGSDGAVSIGATGSISVTDSALLTVNGATTYGGTMTFYLCGPTQGASYTLCTTGGTQIGAVKTVSGSTPTTTVVSDAATITSAGRYCWRADYSGDASVGVPASSDSSVGECFRVTPLQPAISTNASGASGVPIGTAIMDSATLSGAVNNAGGSITFRLYGPDDASCSGTPVFTSAAIAVSGNGNYSSGSFTPLAAGTYRWTAAYTGDAPNTLPVPAVCNAPNEASLIQPRQPAIITVASGADGVALGTAISDLATLSNTAPKPDGTPAGGTITFRVYGPNNPTCTGTPAFTSPAVPVNGNGNYSSGNFTPTAAGTYRWIASYSGDLPNTLAVAGACNDANEASLIISLQPTISTAQSFVPNDSATITVAAGGGDLAGNVVFKLYVNNATCAGAATYTSPSIPISGGTGSASPRPC